MKKSALVYMSLALAGMLVVPSAVLAQAGDTASGTLTVNATVHSSIQLLFSSDASGVPLTSGSGTNTATLDFGTISAFGTLTANVTRSVVAGTSFTVSTPVDVTVNQANSSSANYTLKAQLGSADATNTWKVAGNTITNASATTITSTGTYGSAAAQSIAITVPFSTASGTVISNTISFTATSN